MDGAENSVIQNSVFISQFLSDAATLFFDFSNRSVSDEDEQPQLSEFRWLKFLKSGHMGNGSTDNDEYVVPMGAMPQGIAIYCAVPPGLVHEIVHQVPLVASNSTQYHR